jgi:hypothetical protein
MMAVFAFISMNPASIIGVAGLASLILGRGKSKDKKATAFA